MKVKLGLAAYLMVFGSQICASAYQQVRVAVKDKDLYFGGVRLDRGMTNSDIYRVISDRIGVPAEDFNVILEGQLVPNDGSVANDSFFEPINHIGVFLKPSGYSYADSIVSRAENETYAARIMDYERRATARGRGETPLMYAASRNDIKVLKYLLSHGADVNELTTKNIEFDAPYMALDYARHAGHSDAVEELLKHGALARVHDELQSYPPVV